MNKKILIGFGIFILIVSGLFLASAQGLIPSIKDFFGTRLFQLYPSGSPPVTCGNSTQGDLYFNFYNKTFYGCNSTEWIPIN